MSRARPASGDDRSSPRPPCRRATRVGAGAGTHARGPHGAVSGFSLLEVLVALVVLMAGALAVAASVSNVIAANTMAGEHTRATALAMQKMEELKAMDPANVDDEATVQLDARGEVGSGPYRRTVEVVDDTEGADANTKEVTVTVQYRAGELGTRQIDLFTIIYTG